MGRGNRAGLKRGYLHVYTGNGKGKTTAALGLVLRAAGAGMRVYVGQFLKGRACSEHRALARFGDLVTVRRYGRPTFVCGRQSEADRKAAGRGLAALSRALKSGAWDLVVLDEACVAVRLGLISLPDLLQALRERAPHVEAVVTGRDAEPELLHEADLVTVMHDVKHYYGKGVRARSGIEL